LCAALRDCAEDFFRGFLYLLILVHQVRDTSYLSNYR
jgi:hypothetical protein